ncbi:hypothetical protein HOU02_gp176 [Caulobacter phage CcrBL9]|uniref:Uncharacterized protein n=1 Tax=Caulobacter phage CcrBL9 TaxID=2283270 RepID=A0A385EB64_9CAUD|nr:hypothetical protein HOU02_gp009 [Caulobacter phage CcrBL9]YP_009810179.1 hypothetical protein HOU02_gp176 [Caulobacter phage CcrBL9]AXQ69033.1 hypothetical protein CcrBL9_gp009 [Caulobacter phage CcrBL9]AXQ69549.1 hypothetical protein CcrBL9_gp525 [Caulobacter phage CcrBL9]
MTPNPTEEGKAAARQWLANSTSEWAPEPKNPYRTLARSMTARTDEERRWDAGYQHILDLEFPDDGAEQRAERAFGC